VLVVLLGPEVVIDFVWVRGRDLIICLVEGRDLIFVWARCRDSINFGEI